ncbi:agamous-like MADS-box protein AGL62 [Lolium rigidum]|uniref:agamous-like MADS-box protein AGL62 n=1 Tax=Lolium rigidum TaxID=89674 RepID=UPI001F5D43AE|nr:agamous-like MADS-box protein AGL62 [Lolium rigidum]
MGRRKIEIRRIESRQARQVCFSKRRPGLFKKAGELAVLCGAEVAAVAFSPGGNVFSFGDPSVDSVLGRFRPSNNSQEAQAAAAVGGGVRDRNQAPPELNQELGQVHALLDVEKAQREAADKALAEARAEGLQLAAWLETDVNKLGEEDLVAFVADLAKLGAADAVAARADPVPLDTLHGGGGGPSCRPWWHRVHPAALRLAPVVGVVLVHGMAEHQIAQHDTSALALRGFCGDDARGQDSGVISILGM